MENTKEYLKFDEAGELELSEAEKESALISRPKATEPPAEAPKEDPKPEEPKAEDPKPEQEANTKEPPKDTKEVKEERKSIDVLLKEKITKREVEEKAKAEQDAISKINAEREESLTIEQKAERADALAKAQRELEEASSKLAAYEEARHFQEFERQSDPEEWAVIYPEIEGYISSNKYASLIKAGYTPEERAAQAIAFARGIAVDKIIAIKEAKIKAKLQGKEELESLSNFKSGKTQKATSATRLDILRDKAMTAEGLTPDEIEEMYKLEGL